MSKISLDEVEALAGIVERQMRSIRFLAERGCDATIYVIARDGLSFTFRRLLKACRSGEADER